MKFIHSNKNFNSLINLKQFKFTYTYYRRSYFNSLSLFILFKIINNIMYSGLKDKILRIISNLLLKLRLAYNQDPMVLIVSAVLLIKPVIRLKKKKIAGRNQYIPLFLTGQRQILLGSKLLCVAAKQRLDKSILLKLFNEITMIQFNVLESIAYKKQQELYKLAIENKYCIKYL